MVIFQSVNCKKLPRYAVYIYMVNDTYFLAKSKKKPNHQVSASKQRSGSLRTSWSRGLKENRSPYLPVHHKEESEGISGNIVNTFF